MANWSRMLLQVAESILKSNSTAVAVGNLHALPFADSLSL